jgi:hypothetical protein
VAGLKIIAMNNPVSLYPTSLNPYQDIMKNVLLKAAMLCLIVSLTCSCSQKSGCPSNGKNVGAERLLSGEKVPKAKKFKA